MGFLDRFLGRDEQPADQQPKARYGNRPTSDEAAVERYRYLLRTAPPDAIEQAHAEAFAQLTPEQRRQVLDGLSQDVPEAERAQSDDPRALARMATRAEMRAPGTLENRFGGGGGLGMGGMLAGSLLASVAGAFVGTAIADSFFDLSDGGGADPTADGSDPAADGGGDVAADAGGDAGFGGGFGDFGGDFGGGDF